MGHSKFVENLNKLLELHGASSRLAKATGISKATIMRWKAGGTVSDENIDKLCVYFGKSREWFLTGKEPPPSDTAPRVERRMNLESEPLIEIMGSVWATPFRLSMQQGLGQFIKGKPGEQDCFALRVEGDSMDPVFVAGDIVICRPHSVELLPDEASYVPYQVMRKYHNYDAIVEHEGDTMLKRIQLEQKRGPLYDLFMVSLNPRYPKVKLKFGDDWKMKALVVRSEKPPIPE